jgi:hypothetical protein
LHHSNKLQHESARAEQELIYQNLYSRPRSIAAD